MNLSDNISVFFIPKFCLKLLCLAEMGINRIDLLLIIMLSTNLEIKSQKHLIWGSYRCEINFFQPFVDRKDLITLNRHVLRWNIESFQLAELSLAQQLIEQFIWFSFRIIANMNRNIPNRLKMENVATEQACSRQLCNLVRTFLDEIVGCMCMCC